MAYSDVTDYGPLLRIITISFLAPTSVIFFWRIISKFSRDRRLNAFGVDDVMLILAMVLAWFNATCAILAVENGFGKPGASLKVNQKKSAMFFFWLFQIDYKFQVMFSKLAVLFFYCRVFSADIRFEKWTRFFMAFIIVASIAFGVANILQCIPVQRTWDRKVQGTCFNNTIYWISHAVFHVSTDIIIFFMPIMPISKLNMSSSRKLAVIGAFALGSFVCVADCVRIYYLKVSGKSTDPTYGAGMAVIMTIIVQYLSMICLCLVTGLRKSIITCCQRIRNKDTKRSGYQLSDFQSSNNHNSQVDRWPNSQNKIMAGRSVSEEYIMDFDEDSSSDKDKRGRLKQDIVVKTTFGTTVSPKSTHNQI